MNILITGIAGFIGFNLAQSLLKNNFVNIIGIDNLIDNKTIRYERLNKLNSQIKFYKTDLINYQEVKEVLKDYNIDVLIHLAAIPGIDNSQNNSVSYIENNIIGFTNILNIAKEYKIKKIIYASSSSIYGDQQFYPISENALTKNPKNIYAITKYTNELIANTFIDLYKMNIIGLRLFTVYGEWGRDDMSVYKFVKKNYNNELIEIFGENIERSYTYIGDVIKCIQLLLEKENIKENIYNVGSEDSIKIIKLISTIEKITKIKSKVIIRESKKIDMIKTQADMTLFYNEFNYKPETNIEDGINKFIKWYKGYL